MRSATLSRYGADDWIRTSINRFTRPMPCCSSHVGKHEREDSNPVRQFWRLLALPGAHSCEASPVLRPGTHSHSLLNSTFQYASLTNFDQLSSRTWWRRTAASTSGGPAGAAASCPPRAACGRPCACCTPRTPARSCPARHAALRPRHDVVDRQFLAARLAAAVLARCSGRA